MKVIEVNWNLRLTLYGSSIKESTLNKHELKCASTYMCAIKSIKIKCEWVLHLPGLPRKTEEYNTRLDGSLARVSGGDDHSLRHHRPVKKEKNIFKLLWLLLATLAAAAAFETFDYTSCWKSHKITYYIFLNFNFHRRHVIPFLKYAICNKNS